MKDFNIKAPIVIMRSGNKTTAYDPNTNKKAIARCHPDDKYDAYLGAKIALDRLFGREPVKPEPNVTFRVLAIKGDLLGLFSKGNVYEFIDGVTKWDSGNMSCKYNSFDQFMRANSVFKDKLVELKPGDDPAEVLRDHERYNGKVVFTRDIASFTGGKIYEIVNGKVVDNDGDLLPSCIVLKNFDDVDRYFLGGVIEIKE